MVIIASLGVILVLLFGPQLWVKYVFRKYNTDLPQLPGNGGELAEHLLDRLGYEDISTEITEAGDHYDPQKKSVCLSPASYQGRSLTAIVIAAHEVGHAIQHKSAYKPMVIREHLARFAGMAEKIAGLVLVSFPFAAIITRQPLVGGLMFALGLGILLLPVLFHFVTLPVEFDASFNRALPILIQGNYLPASAEPVVRQILTAAALTYLSASLFSLLNFYRWLIFLRR